MTLQTGSGSFTATDGPAITASPTTSRTRSTTTIEVYVSYCPQPILAGAIMGLGTNFSSSSFDDATNPHAFNASDPNSSPVDDDNTDNPLCQTCPNSVGVCCPPTVSCDDADGKCPEQALVLSSNTINGYLIAQVMNSTAPVAGRKKVRALPRKKKIDAAAGAASKPVAGDGAGENASRDEKKRKRERREF